MALLQAPQGPAKPPQVWCLFRPGCSVSGVLLVSISPSRRSRFNGVPNWPGLMGGGVSVPKTGKMPLGPWRDWEVEYYWMAHPLTTRRNVFRLP